MSAWVRLVEILEGPDLLSRPIGLLWRGWRRRGDDWFKGGDRLPTSSGRHQLGISGAPGGPVIVRVLVRPMEQFSAETGRGRGGGWIVDSEVYRPGPGGRPEEFIFHNESRVEGRDEALALASKMRDWLDRRSVSSLMSTARSGPLSMSKRPEGI